MDDTKPKNPNERLTSKQVSEEFNIPEGTLRYWRGLDRFNVMSIYPRSHKMLTGKVFYFRSEIEEDLAKISN
jgi:hypothetical protein